MRVTSGHPRLDILSWIKIAAFTVKLNWKAINQTSELNTWWSSVTGCELTEDKRGRSDTQSKLTSSPTSQHALMYVCVRVCACVCPCAQRHSWFFYWSCQTLMAPILLQECVSGSKILCPTHTHSKRFTSPRSFYSCESIHLWIHTGYCLLTTSAWVNVAKLKSSHTTFALSCTCSASICRKQCIHYSCSRSSSRQVICLPSVSQWLCVLMDKLTYLDSNYEQ